MRGVLVLLAVPLLAADPSAKGFDHFYNLEYQEAIACFREEIAANPMDPAAYNHLSQAILYRALYRSGLLEDSLISGEDPLLSMVRQPRLILSEEEENEFSWAMSTAVRLARERIESHPGDGNALLALGSARALRANYKFLVRKAWLSALRDAGAGLRLHQRVLEIDPLRADARLLGGVHDYVVATLPASLRVLGAVAGLHGDKDRGLRTIAAVASLGKVNRVDAQILLATLYRHEKHFAEAIPLFEALGREYPRNHLFLLAALTTRLEAGDIAGARLSFAALEPAWRKADPAGAAGKLPFALGLIEMRAGNLDAALNLFQRSAGAQGLVYSGHVHDLKGERELALRAYRGAIALAPQSRCGRRSEQYLSKPYRAKPPADPN